MTDLQTLAALSVIAAGTLSAVGLTALYERRRGPEPGGDCPHADTDEHCSEPGCPNDVNVCPRCQQPEGTPVTGLRCYRPERAP